ncbi:Sensor_kinase_SpoOB-type, alpha-helical domain [Nocardioides alpinus]|uniref:histidine kinase n=1 Tax=Nocardioides alpinus TaxID=748909 RepID=A0A1I0XDV3_9ACTN|nr:Sensor_kinase_SpoOB-type, alpha-helical domain [Nocardioides alpinus]
MFAVADDGTITVLSDSARELIGLDGDVEGRRVDDLDLDPAIRGLLTDDAEIRDHVVVLGDRVLVVNRNPVLERGRRVASVTTLRDRTELLALQSELSARQSITNTLRAQTHEFHNQLHTISGLVQLGEYDEVSRLIGTLSRRRAEISDAVTAHVEDPAVAALLIAKTSLAAERGVDLRLSGDSDLPRLDPESSTDVGTVLGNLVDNAVDASVSVGGTSVEVTLHLDEATVRLGVADTGPGVPPDRVGEIFRRGWSSKASTVEGRGVGLALVQVVCERRGGGVTVRAGETGGAVFEAVLKGVQSGVEQGAEAR